MTISPGGLPPQNCCGVVESLNDNIIIKLLKLP